MPPFAARESTTSPMHAIRSAVAAGFRVTTNTTLYDDADPVRLRKFFDTLMDLGVEGMMISPGYSYAKAPDQEHFLPREKTIRLFQRLFDKRPRRWRFNHSPLFLEFLQGNWQLECTPWGNPTYNVFGWQKPCYLLDEGYVQTFHELLDTTDWNAYGRASGNPKCRDCMMHCGYEPTAVNATFGSLRGLWGAARSVMFGSRRPQAPDSSRRTADRPLPGICRFSIRRQGRLAVAAVRTTSFVRRCTASTVVVDDRTSSVDSHCRRCNRRRRSDTDSRESAWYDSACIGRRAASESRGMPLASRRTATNTVGLAFPRAGNSRAHFAVVLGGHRAVGMELCVSVSHESQGAMSIGAVLLIWTAAVLVSILVHEFGHALTFRYFGVPSRISCCITSAAWRCRERSFRSYGQQRRRRSQTANC